MRRIARPAASLLAVAIAGCSVSGGVVDVRKERTAVAAVAPPPPPAPTLVTPQTPPPPEPKESTPPAVAPPPSPPLPELPLGGRTIFPQYRLIGFCGTPGAPALGPLAGNLPAKTKQLKAFAAKFPPDRKPLLVFELIAVVVQSWQGADGMYRRRIDDTVIQSFLKAAREAKGLLLLNVQPGKSDFMTEVKRLEPYLKEPDVGLALDPEWAVHGKQKPGVYYGHTTGAVIDEVAAYLADIVKSHDLPEKVLVFHQLNKYVVTDEAETKMHPGVVIVKSVDGLGPKHSKRVTYDSLMKTTAEGVHPGFKLFLDEDTRLGGKVMTPAEVMSLKPQPEYVMVE